MIKNLTPHDITIMDKKGILAIVPHCKQIARVATTKTELPDIFGIPVVTTTFGELENLPEPEEGTIFIVSRLVLNACSRPDLYAPGELVRDDNGNPIGCMGLSR